MLYCELNSYLRLKWRIREDDRNRYPIETYKIVTGKYDIAVSPKLEKVNSYITRGNDLRLHKRRSRYDLRKYSFTNRVVDVWNCLPNWVVSADTTNNFKTRLDKHWHNEDIIYDFTAQLHGTGSRMNL